MGQNTDNEETEDEGSQQAASDDLRVIFINGVKHEINREDEYTASDLIELAGDDPTDHTLVATKGESGKDDKVFDDDEVIDFDDQHRKHFETKATGDTFI